MTPEQRRRLRLRRLLGIGTGGRLAIASVAGLTGAGAVLTQRPGDIARQPDMGDPVKAAVAETMVERMAGRGWDLPNLEHERVDFWVDRFQNVPEMRTKMEQFLSRAGMYMPMLSVKLAERDMPHDLIFLAMIESGFDATAYSHAHASGIWQFIPETGQRYGLRVDNVVDERNHPELATDAALDYLTVLHERFDSWYLAAAAYNTGENRVGRIMLEETGSERATSEEDYYRIWDRLPSETRDYVPLMIAAARIAKDPGTYGFEHVIPNEALDIREVEVAPGTSLQAVAQTTGASLDELRFLNPHLVRGATPASGRYAVRVPTEQASQLAMSDLRPEGAQEIVPAEPGTRLAEE